MTIIGFVIMLIVGFFSLIGNAENISYDVDQNDPIDRYDIVRRAEVSDPSTYLGVLLPRDWITTCSGTILFYTDRELFDEPCIYRELPAESLGRGSVNVIRRGSLNAFDLSEDAAALDVAQGWTRNSDLDERGIRQFDAGDRPAAMATTIERQSDGSTEYIIHVFVEFEAGFASLLMFTSDETKVFEFEEIMRAVASTVVVEVAQ